MSRVRAPNQENDDLISETVSSNTIIAPNDITSMIEEHLLSLCLPQEKDPLKT